MLDFVFMEQASEHNESEHGIFSSPRWMLPALIAVALLVMIAAAYLYFDHSQQTNSVLPIAATSSVNNTTTPLIPQLRTAEVMLSSGKTISLNVPMDYSINVAADGFAHVRFMAWSPDHRLFVGEMTNASDTHTGRVLILDGFDPQTRTFAGTHVYLDSLRNPNSVAFYRDPEGKEWIYVAITDKLIRYLYADGDNVPSAAPQVLATFPDFGPTAAEGGWHLTRTLAFHGDMLYVSVGSGCNSCEEPGVTRGDILEMNPDGSNSHSIANGLRNAVGIIYAAGVLYATANEVDHLGNDKPNDLVYKISEGANYGWPYCYQYNGAIYDDTTKQWQNPYDCSKVPMAFAELEPHSAPLGLEYFDGTFADSALHNSFLVAEHGSGKPSIGTGYVVSLVRNGTSTPFVSGFLSNDVRQGRPVDILRNDDHSFFVTDDFNGAVYYMQYNN
jgi:glucose/arabinose dehydrogenase